MRPLIYIALFLFSISSFSQDETSQLNWLTNMDEAEAISKKENKLILVYFTGSDWCSPCVALKKDFFETEEFAERAKNLVLVMIDYPRRSDIISEEQRAYNKKIMAKYNTNKSFPKLVMVNSGGSEMGKLSGYSQRDTSHHFTFVDEYLTRN